jgi:hypothetical protein
MGTCPRVHACCKGFATPLVTTVTAGLGPRNWKLTEIQR